MTTSGQQKPRPSDASKRAFAIRIRLSLSAG
jgi:hypothetical protein